MIVYLIPYALKIKYTRTNINNNFMGQTDNLFKLKCYNYKGRLLFLLICSKLQIHIMYVYIYTFMYIYFFYLFIYLCINIYLFLIKQLIFFILLTTCQLNKDIIFTNGLKFFQITWKCNGSYVFCDVENYCKIIFVLYNILIICVCVWI